MAHAVFGSRLDLHAGGADLAFPHHCNELAQAQAFYACGAATSASDAEPPPSQTPLPPHEWVSHWLHTGHVHIAGRKMSKSLKNFVSVREMIRSWDGEQAAASAGAGAGAHAASPPADGPAAAPRVRERDIAPLQPCRGPGVPMHG